ncbi:MAG: DUF4111 domain-containing protein [Haliscomenobacteraceae bacterium CHB4]|nr:hypothetical protein [Saprospiraceae bacterium]MCE7923274.1 DUF4111 domain-containing protein [Haliscomenobacteraceae bacterium CHB4]
MNFSLPPSAEKVLDYYFQGIDATLPGFLEGFYIYGSLSLADFRPYKSDIDFVAVTTRLPTPLDIEKLVAIHRKTRWRFLQTDMNGLYVHGANIPASVRGNRKCICFQNGKPSPENLHENNLITWYQLKNNAIVLRGPHPKVFPYEVSANDLRMEMKRNLNAYWVNWMARHRRFGLEKLLLLGFSQKTEWGVLGVSRQWYTLETGGITSKTGAGEYCLNQFSDWYGDILETALAIRANRPAPIRNARRRAQATFDYMEFLIQEFNQRYEKLYANS